MMITFCKRLEEVFTKSNVWITQCFCSFQDDVFVVLWSIILTFVKSLVLQTCKQSVSYVNGSSEQKVISSLLRAFTKKKCLVGHADNFITFPYEPHMVKRKPKDNTSSVGSGEGSVHVVFTFCYYKWRAHALSDAYNCQVDKILILIYDFAKRGCFIIPFQSW